MFYAIKRQFMEGSSFTPQEKIDPQTAMKAYTLNPAISVGMENSLGKIAAGYEADLVIFKNFTETDPRGTKIKGKISEFRHRRG